jgi:hypothetical protein
MMGPPMEGGPLHKALLFAAPIGIIGTLLIAAGLVYYIHRALKLRVAMAPGWSFERDRQPFLYWLQVGAVGWFALETLARLVLAVVVLAKLL